MLINLFALLSSTNEWSPPGFEKPPVCKEHSLKPTFVVQIACICSWEREKDPCHDTPTEMYLYFLLDGKTLVGIFQVCLQHFDLAVNYSYSKLVVLLFSPDGGLKYKLEH